MQSPVLPHPFRDGYRIPAKEERRFAGQGNSLKKLNDGNYPYEEYCSAVLDESIRSFGRGCRERHGLVQISIRVTSCNLQRNIRIKYCLGNALRRSYGQDVVSSSVGLFTSITSE